MNNDILRHLSIHLHAPALHAYLLSQRKLWRLFADDKMQLNLMSLSHLHNIEVMHPGNHTSFFLFRRLPNGVQHGLQMEYYAVHDGFYSCQLRYGLLHGLETWIKYATNEMYFRKHENGHVVEMSPEFDHHIGLRTYLVKHYGRLAQQGWAHTVKIDPNDKRGLFPRRILKITHGYHLEVYHQTGQLQMKGGLEWKVYNRNGEVTRGLEWDNTIDKFRIKYYRKDGLVRKVTISHKYPGYNWKDTYNGCEGHISQCRLYNPEVDGVYRELTIFGGGQGPRSIIRFDRQGRKHGLEINYWKSWQRVWEHGRVLSMTRI